MKQVLHIFRKDVRHRWPEIIVVFALLIAYAWVEVRSWTHPEFNEFGVRGILGSFPGLIRALVPLSWIFLLVRNTQGESLVGDRQFWITRPYGWRQLLSAKLLFSLAFINLPLSLLQMFLLQQANFPIRGHILGLVSIQLGILIFVFLPVTTAASVTNSIAQFGLLVLVLALYIAGVVYLDSITPNSSFSSPADTLEFCLLLGTLIAVIFLQYSRRKTTLSRLLLIGLALTVAVIVAASPYRYFANREYPPLRTGATTPMQLSLDTSGQLPKGKAPFGYVDSKTAHVHIPLKVSGIDSNSIIDLDGHLVFLQSQDGFQWSSGWGRQYEKLFPDRSEVGIDFELNREMFEKIKSSPLKLGITVAYAVYDDQDRREFVTPANAFVLPEIGRCSAAFGYSRGIRCFAPFPVAFRLLITTDLSKNTCPIKEDETLPKAGTMARDWTSYSESGPEPSISPIQEINLYLDSHAQAVNAGICPGTPLVLSHPKLLDKAQTTIHLDNIRLIDFVSSDSDGFVIGIR